MPIPGLANAPLDVGIFSLRQRRTVPAWFGRAFAVSMGLNWGGTPIGSALSGPLIHVGLTVAFVVAAAVIIFAGALLRWVVPAEHLGTMAGGNAPAARPGLFLAGKTSAPQEGGGGRPGGGG